MLFLRNGDLVICPSRQPTCVWDIETDKKLYELDAPGPHHVVEIVQLPTGDVVTGPAEGDLSIWNLGTRKLARNVKHHLYCPSYYLLVLPNGHLVCACRHAIVIRDPYEDDDKQKMVVFSDSLDYQSQIYMLSNGFLVTFKRRDDQFAFGILNPYTGEKVTSINIQSDLAQFATPRSLVLKNGDFVLFEENGRVQKHNLLDGSKFKSSFQPSGRLVRALATPNSLRSFSVLTLRDFDLPAFQPIPYGSIFYDPYPVTSSAISPDGKNLILGCNLGKFLKVNLAQ